MAKVYLFGGHFGGQVEGVDSNLIFNGVVDLVIPIHRDVCARDSFSSKIPQEAFTFNSSEERYYLNEMCFDRFDLNLRAIETSFFIVGSTERSELDQINQKLIRYANRGVRITASRVRVV